jgi:hypothetical protein
MRPMHITGYVDDLTLERGTSLNEKPGTTCAGVSAVEWELRLPGRPLLTVHDTRWDNGERDLVLYQPTVVPEIPAVLSNLHNRLRVGIARAGKHNHPAHHGLPCLGGRGMPQDQEVPHHGSAGSQIRSSAAA